MISTGTLCLASRKVSDEVRRRSISSPETIVSGARWLLSSRKRSIRPVVTALWRTVSARLPVVPDPA